eukprot:gene10552-2677_t
MSSLGLKGKMYNFLSNLGEGQFGTVFLAEHIETHEKFAIKKIKIGSKQEAAEGLHRTAFREIKFLQEVKHQHVIQLRDVYSKRSNIFLVLELCHFDVEKLISRNEQISGSDIKAIMLQCLHGLEYLHGRWILHRDIKPNNVFISQKGVIKLGDFGLASTYGSPTRAYTSQVVTLHYRSPELLFGAKVYDGGVDVWAMGCLHAELELRKPLLPGSSEIDQLDRIFTLKGSATEQNWPGVRELPGYLEFGNKPGIPLREILTATSLDAVALMEWMTTCNPRKRCSASLALQHEYFSNPPGPSPFVNVRTKATLNETDGPKNTADAKRRHILDQPDSSGAKLSRMLFKTETS